MAEYLSPTNEELTTEEKRKLFAFRNNMTLMNYSKIKLNKTCSCGKMETLEHIYSCKRFNKEESEILFEILYSKNIKNQIKVFRRLEKALENRENIAKIENVHVTFWSPLLFVVFFINIYIFPVFKTSFELVGKS